MAGRFRSESVAKLRMRLQGAGATVVDEVSRSVDIVFDGYDGNYPNERVRAAERLDVPVLSVEELLASQARPTGSTERLRERGARLRHPYTIDHFGLDPDDEITEYGFIDWFTLQHYDRFGGKYPPPIAQADIEIPISGTF